MKRSPLMDGPRFARNPSRSTATSGAASRSGLRRRPLAERDRPDEIQIRSRARGDCRGDGEVARAGIRRAFRVAAGRLLPLKQEKYDHGKAREPKNLPPGAGRSLRRGAVPGLAHRPHSDGAAGHATEAADRDVHALWLHHDAVVPEEVARPARQPRTSSRRRSSTWRLTSTSSSCPEASAR